MCGALPPTLRTVCYIAILLHGYSAILLIATLLYWYIAMCIATLLYWYIALILLWYIAMLLCSIALMYHAS